MFRLKIVFFSLGEFCDVEGRHVANQYKALYYLRGGFKYILFSPLPGEMIQAH